jgi:hypothetical protein
MRATRRIRRERDAELASPDAGKTLAFSCHVQFSKNHSTCVSLPVVSIAGIVPIATITAGRHDARPGSGNLFNHR